MTHGDDSGLILPPRVAPVQVIAIPIWRKEPERALVSEALENVAAGLRAAGIRVKVDWRDDVTPGFKYNEWELKGVPLRLELGPRDVAGGQAVLVRRDVQPKQREVVSQGDLATRVAQLLQEIQHDMLERARAYQTENTVSLATWQELESTLAERNVFVDASWCGDGACETQIQERTRATIRNIPDGTTESPLGHVSCVANQGSIGSSSQKPINPACRRRPQLCDC